jgi:hypothetical protein
MRLSNFERGALDGWPRRIYQVHLQDVLVAAMSELSTIPRKWLHMAPCICSALGL